MLRIGPELFRPRLNFSILRELKPDPAARFISDPGSTFSTPQELQPVLVLQLLLLQWYGCGTYTPLPRNHDDTLMPRDDPTIWTGDGLWPVYPMICHTYQSAVLQTLVSYGFPYHPWEENATLSTQLSKIFYRTQFGGGVVLHANSLNREMSACSCAGRSLSLLIFGIPLFLPGDLQPRNANILADPLQGQIQNLFRYVTKPAAKDIAFPKSDMGEIPSIEKATYSCWRISGDSRISWAIFSRIAVAINVLFYCNDVSFRPHNRIGLARLNVCVDSGFCCQVHILMIVERVGESSMPSLMIEPNPEYDFKPIDALDETGVLFKYIQIGRNVGRQALMTAKDNSILVQKKIGDV